MIRKIKISSRLTVGFFMLVLILTISSIRSIFQITSITRNANNVVELRIPTAQASASVLNGVRQTYRPNNNITPLSILCWKLNGGDR